MANRGNLIDLTPEQLSERSKKARKTQYRYQGEKFSSVEEVRALGQKGKIIEDAAEKIKELMAREGVSYKELAERLGVSRPLISHFLSGYRNMTLYTLVQIGEALGYSFTLVAHPIDDE